MQGQEMTYSSPFTQFVVLAGFLSLLPFFILKLWFSKVTRELLALSKNLWMLLLLNCSLLLVQNKAALRPTFLSMTEEPVVCDLQDVLGPKL